MRSITPGRVLSREQQTEITRIIVKAGPVSYTHLDVYKRQLQYYQNGVALPQPPLSLLVGEAGAAPAPLVLPDSAILCSCHNVSKGDVVAAVRAGNHELSAVKSCTKAGTGCGGCSNLLKQVVDQTLADLGVEADKGLCEHFAYGRQERCV